MRTWIKGTELQVGHVVVAYDHLKEFSSLVDYGNEHQYRIDKFGTLFGNARRISAAALIHVGKKGAEFGPLVIGMTFDLGLSDPYWWLVVAGPTAKAPSTSSAWNGKCLRCGRGTYTGLFATEHEGGPCGA